MNTREAKKEKKRILDLLEDTRIPVAQKVDYIFDLIDAQRIALHHFRKERDALLIQAAKK